MLRDVGDSQFDQVMRGRAGDILALQQYLPGVRFQEAVNRLEQSRFSDAVGAKHSGNLRFLCLQRDTPQDIEVFIIAYVQVFYLKHLHPLPDRLR